MKKIKKAAAIILMLALCLQLSSVTAFAKDKPVPSNIEYRNISLEDMSKNELETKNESKLTLVENSKSSFVIILPDNCDAEVKTAANVLSDVIYQMSECRIEIADKPSKKDLAINIINKNNSSAKGDGYRIKITDNSIDISADNAVGLRNGIYGFAEDYLGCMFLTADDTFVPKHESVYLEKCDDTHTPKMLWRDVYTYEVSFNGWAAKLRLNAVDSSKNPPVDNIEKSHHYDWGTWCHNCYAYLPPEKYFESHPEYYSEFEGKRITSYNDINAYLCLSNPEVLEHVKADMKKRMDENPNKIYWDFSGNDNPALAGCQCEKCLAMNQRAGGTGMGSLMPFINELAKEFPDKYISTLAYLHTVEAPKGIELEDNIVIKLCSMPGDQAYSYLNGGVKGADDFKKQVEDWSKITDKIVVWDYVVNFSNLLLPFPNFAVQAENQKFYEDNNVIGVFHQGSREKGGEFAELRSYVLAHMLWEGSTMNVSECVSKYVAAYYGDAAPKVIEYINLLSSSLYESKKPLGLYDHPNFHRNGYLSKDNLFKYEAILNDAKIAVKDNPTHLQRLEKIEISVLYGLMSHPRIDKEAREDYKNRFNELCDKHEIVNVRETQTREEFFKNDYEQAIDEETKIMNKPYVIAFSTVIGISAALILSIAIIKHIKKKQK